LDVATGTGDFAIQAYRDLLPEELIGSFRRQYQF